MALGIAGTVALLILAVATFLAVLWFVLPAAASRPCPSCAARQPRDAAACAVCAAPLPGPPDGHPGARPYGFVRPAARRSPAPRIEGGEAFNRGITRRALTFATAAMALGIGLRLAGMLGALGLPQVPAVVDGVLTIAGGVLAFVGFVFLDAA